jgi:hypothetical protein
MEEGNAATEQVIGKDEARRGPIEAGASAYAVALALTYSDAGLHAEGAARMDKIRECKNRLGGRDFDGFFAHCRAVAYQRAGRLDEADRVMRELAEFNRKRGDSSGQLKAAKNLEVLGVNLLLQQRFSEAEQTAREAMELYETNWKDDRDVEIDWRLPYVKNVLGGALLGQKKYAEAEPLLVQGYEGMKQAEATMTANWRYRLPEAGERVIRYYEDTNQPDKARAWREKLAVRAETKTPPKTKEAKPE